LAVNNKLYLLLSGLIITILTQCANPVVPSGGNKDITPPKIIEINHDKKKNEIAINFTFNEQVVTGNIENTFILSPASLNKLSVTSGYRSISIAIRDTIPLHENSYLQLMPGWVKDLNEKNNADSIPFHFIFSYNQSLKDSTVILSKIQPTNTVNKTNLNIYLFDTAPENKSFVGKPFTKADKQGSFMFPSFAYSAADQYILLDDLNRNHTIDSNEYYCLLPVNSANKNNNIIPYSYPIVNTKLKFEIDPPIIRVSGLRGSLITDPQFYSYNFDTGYLIYKSEPIPNRVEDYEGRTHRLNPTQIKIMESISATQYFHIPQQLRLRTTKPIQQVLNDTLVIYLSDSTYVKRNYQITSTNEISIMNMPENAVKLSINPKSIKYETGDSNTNLSISIQPKALIYGTITLQKNKADSNQYLVFFAKDGILNKQIIKSNQDMISTQLPLGKYDAIIVLDSDKNTRYSLSDINIMKLEEPTAIKKGVQITDKIENTLILDRFSLFPFMSPTR
jgi:hypothetical protein